MICTIGEIMLRLSPPYYNKIEQASSFNVTYGGGEANVAISLAKLGHRTKFITQLPSNQLGESALKHLRGYNVDVSDIILKGDNIGIYFLEMGFGGRTSQVLYNRKYSAFTNITYDAFDFERILDETNWLHVSGITLALGDNAKKTIIELLKRAKQKDVIVSFDFNYRSKLWTVEEAKETIQCIMPYVDVCFASLFDIETIVGLKIKDQYDDINEKRKAVFNLLFQTYPITYLFGTIRNSHSANENSLSAYAYTKDNTYLTKDFRFNIVDRIGGGDAFVSGVIHRLITDYNNLYDATDFGLFTSILKHTIQGDACILSEGEILDFMNNLGHSCVQR